MNIAILGAQAGDESKGRVTHDFSPQYDWVVRFSGGANAGHTIYRDGKKYVHNLMPSFDWRASKPKAFLGSGMVIDLQQLLKEVSDLYQIDPSFPSRVYVDLDAFLVLPEHKEEDKRTNSHIGSTNRGIGPAYKYKMARSSYKIRDALLQQYLYPTGDDCLQQLSKMGVNFCYSYQLKNDFSNQDILFEGAQGLLLDINHGSYPYVSCGDSTLAGIIDSGFGYLKIDKVYGVAKCYCTRVGEGPFPTELFGEEASALRERGKEYGATTGRPRRVGWLDLQALLYACDRGGITDLIISKFDILEGMRQVPVCTKYQAPLFSPQNFEKAKPILTMIPGWENSKNLSSLEPFINLVEAYTNRKVSYISYGVEPEDLVQWKSKTYLSK